jgi:cytosine/uracil/thiamine/allantoin permease
LRFLWHCYLCSGLFAQGSTTAALAGTVVDEKGARFTWCIGNCRYMSLRVLVMVVPQERMVATTLLTCVWVVLTKLLFLLWVIKNAVQSGIVLTLAQELTPKL